MRKCESAWVNDWEGISPGNNDDNDSKATSVECM